MFLFPKVKIDGSTEWALSEEMFERLLLEGTQVSEEDLDTFLGTTDVEEVVATFAEERSSVFEQMVPTVDSPNEGVDSPMGESLMDNLGINGEGGLVKNSSELFSDVGTDDGFIIFHDVYNHEDSLYDHFYMSHFDEDSFF